MERHDLSQWLSLSFIIYEPTRVKVIRILAGQVTKFAAIAVFARVAPEQKELIMTTFKSSGRITFMCGDGTNDVRPLKQPASEAKPTKPKKPKSDAEPSSSSVTPAANNHHLTPAEVQRQKLKKMVDELNEGDDGWLTPIVKLGDASVAKPLDMLDGFMLVDFLQLQMNRRRNEQISRLRKQKLRKISVDKLKEMLKSEQGRANEHKKLVDIERKKPKEFAEESRLLFSVLL
ncbi:probable manganese-transporting ATPase PDR2 [Tanacetum coccineum]